jgi:hypothetical protein
MPVIIFALRYLYRQTFGPRDLGYWLAANRISDVTTSLLGLFMTQVCSGPWRLPAGKAYSLTLTVPRSPRIETRPGHPRLNLF